MPDFPLFEKEVNSLGARKMFQWVLISTCVSVIVVRAIYATHRTIYIGLIAYSQIQPRSVTKCWPSSRRALCCITVRQQPKLIIVRQGKNKWLSGTVLIKFLLTLQFHPLIWCKASNYLVVVSLAHHHSVPNVSAVLIKFVHFEIVLWSSIQQVRLLDFSVKKLGQVHPLFILLYYFRAAENMWSPTLGQQI